MPREGGGCLMSEAVKLTNELLKATMTDAMVLKPDAKNVDECRTMGYYRIFHTTTGNIPSEVSRLGAILEVIRWDENRQFQRLFSVEGIYYRVASMEVWGAWRKLAMSEIT